MLQPLARVARAASLGRACPCDEGVAPMALIPRELHRDDRERKDAPISEDLPWGWTTVPPRIGSTLRVEVAAHSQGHERLPRVHAVLGLVEHHGAGAVDDLVGDLLAAVGRQAVHI
jgi:hypothetical protein